MQVHGRWRLGRSQFEASPGKSWQDPISTSNSGMMVLMYKPSLIRIRAKASPGKKCKTPSEKKTKAKRAGAWFKW
jgi:hypothetical protein